MTDRKVNNHLRPMFANMDAIKLKRADIERYKDKRVAEGAAAATVKRMLSALRRALNIGIEYELIASTPVVKLLPENNACLRFVEEDVYRAFLRKLPDHAELPWVFSYYVGIRKGELLRLKWAWVDWTTWQIMAHNLEKQKDSYHFGVR
jgi:integrase